MKRIGIHMIPMFCVLLSATSIYGQNQIDSYEYWFDGDFANRTTVAITPTSEFELNTALITPALEPGTHSVEIHFLDTDSAWSSAMKQIFYVPPPISGDEISNLEYWFDDDYSNAQSVALSPASTVTVTDALNAVSLDKGTHEVSVRIQDDLGNWSPPMNKFIRKVPASADNKVDRFRYWFNDETGTIYDSVLVVPQNPLELLADLPTFDLMQALNHSISIQFRDEAENWSAVLTSSFNKIIGCWGDVNGDDNVDTQDLLGLLSFFGCTENCDTGDFNFDGLVNSQDLLIFLSLFNTSCL